MSCTSSFALAQSNWVFIAENKQGSSTWEFQPGSLEFSKTRGGINIAVVTGRVTNKSTSQVDLNKWYVSANDCDKKMGQLVALNISGDFKHENDFVFGSGNIATALAEAICDAANYRMNENKKKGI